MELTLRKIHCPLILPQNSNRKGHAQSAVFGDFKLIIQWMIGDVPFQKLGLQSLLDYVQDWNIFSMSLVD